MGATTLSLMLVYTLCAMVLSRRLSPQPLTPRLGGGECVGVDYRATAVASGGNCFVVPTFAPSFLGDVDPPGLNFCFIDPGGDISVLGMSVRTLAGIACIIAAIIIFAAAFRN